MAVAGANLPPTSEMANTESQSVSFSYWPTIIITTAKLDVQNMICKRMHFLQRKAFSFKNDYHNLVSLLVQLH